MAIVQVLKDIQYENMLTGLNYVLYVTKSAVDDGHIRSAASLLGLISGNDNQLLFYYF